MPTTNTILGWLTATVVVLSSGLAASRQDQDRPLLLGGALPSKKREIRLDPRLPTGVWREFSLRPELVSPLRACSFTRPVCVQGTPGVEEPQVARALAAMELAYERVVIALGMPAPLPDGTRGGSDALDLYLVQEGPLIDVGLDAQSFGLFDQGSSFCRSSAAGALELERAATQCVGEAIVRRLDAGATPHGARAFATHLWWVTGRPTALDVEALDNFQASPERAPYRRDLNALSEGAAAWFELLEATRGRGSPAGMASAIMTLAGSTSAVQSPRWNNEPDALDVLRHTLNDDPFEVSKLMAQWSVERAFVGSRDDGTGAKNLRWGGDFGRVRFDWRMKYSELPRRVAAKYPLEPTGNIYVLLELDDVALGATLGFQAEWEAPVAFAWTLVLLDAEGHELRRLDVPFKEAARSTEQRLSNFEVAAYVMLVGTNMGGLDRDHPFDPDIAPYEPQSCTVYLVRL
ncbi:MAG TPA: hypothetical protein VI197_25355 [Polyangiaceae bacterium]